jgi:hypothetical protein
MFLVKTQDRPYNLTLYERGRCLKSGNFECVCCLVYVFDLHFVKVTLDVENCMYPVCHFVLLPENLRAHLQLSV